VYRNCVRSSGASNEACSSAGGGMAVASSFFSPASGVPADGVTWMISLLFFATLSDGTSAAFSSTTASLSFFLYRITGPTTRPRAARLRGVGTSASIFFSVAACAWRFAMRPPISYDFFLTGVGRCVWDVLKGSGVLFAGARSAGDLCIYFDAILIDFVGELFVCLVGSGVATLRSGVPKFNLAGVAFLGVFFAEAVLNSVREGVPFFALPFLAGMADLAGVVFAGVPVILEGDFVVVFAAVLAELFPSTNSASILTGLAGRDVVSFFGVPLPLAAFFFGVTLLIGNSHTKWKPLSPTSSFCFVGDSLLLAGLLLTFAGLFLPDTGVFRPFAGLSRFSRVGDRGGVAGDIATSRLKRR